MKIVTVSIRASYSIGSPEQKIELMRSALAELKEGGFISPDTPEPNYEYQSYEILMTSDDFVYWSSREEYNVELVKNGTFIPSFIQALAIANEKRPHVFDWEGHQSSCGAPVHPDFNQVVNVHTPGNALSLFNEVMLAEDMCTDGLQTQMSEGWRIIAVCPQPDQRRPDYILGRFNATQSESVTYARRASNPPTGEHAQHLRAGE